MTGDDGENSDDSDDVLDTIGESSPESVNESTGTEHPHASTSSDVNEGDARKIMKPSHGDPIDDEIESR